MCTYLCVSLFVLVWVCDCVHVYVFMYGTMGMSTCMCMWVCDCVCVCMYGISMSLCASVCKVYVNIKSPYSNSNYCQYSIVITVSLLWC